MADTAYWRVHVVINPASGKDEPVLNVSMTSFANTVSSGTSA
jgi:hypothetical protein